MSYLAHHGIKGQRWGVRRFQNKDGTRTAAGKRREAENLRSSQEAKNVNSKIHSYINKQLSSEDLDTGKSNFDFASDLIKDPDFEKVIMPVVQDIRQTKAKYGNKEPYEFTGDEHQAYMNDISRIDNKAGELAITIGLAEKGEPHKKSIPPEGEYERVDMFRYALARYLDEHSPDGYSDEGDWIYHTSIGGTMYIEGNTLILGDSSYLEHHGIRGQRWGVRRFQNRDGSLTNAGRKRLGYATKGAAQAVGKAFKAGARAGVKAAKAVKAHHEKKEAEKLQKKKDKASKTRLGVMANKDLFTNEEIRKLNERFKLEDEMKMATLQKGVEIAKAVGTIAQNVGTVAKTYEDVTGQSLSPIKRKAAEEKARQEKEDRERKLAREDAEEARKAAKEERDIQTHEQTLRKAIALADQAEFTAKKTKADADSAILDLYKKGKDFNSGGDAKTDTTGQSWMEKATAGGKNPFFEEKLKNDPELAAAKKRHDEKVEWQQHEKERDARVFGRDKQSSSDALNDMINKSNSRTGRGTSNNPDDIPFTSKNLRLEKDRYAQRDAFKKAKEMREDAKEKKAKEQDEKAVNQTIDDMMEARRQFTDSARANSGHAFDRETAANYIKGKAKELPGKLNPINAISKKITDKVLKDEEASARKALKDQYKDAARKEGRDEANYLMYNNRVNALQSQGYSERQAKKVADTEAPFSAKRNRKSEYASRMKDIEATHRKNMKEINKAEKASRDKYYELRDKPGYEWNTPKREALERKYQEQQATIEKLRKDNDDMLDRESKKARNILEHSFSIQNGVLFIDSSDGLTHHGVKGQRWGVRRFQNADGSLTPKGRKHYEKKIEKLDRKQVNSDNRRGALERQHPFAVTASAVLVGSAYAALMVASAANPAMVVAGSAIAATVSALGTHVDYSIAEAWEARGTKRRKKKRKEYEAMLNHDGLIVPDGTLYLVHHGVKGQRWGVRRFQNPDGTRTEAGKKHDAKMAAKAEKKAAKIAAKDAKRSAKAEKIRAKAVERYERKAALSRRESEAEAYKLVARDTKKASQKELLSDQKVSTTIAVGQGILGAIALASYGIPTVAAVAGGAAIVGVMRNYNLETVRTNKTLMNLKGAEKARLAKSRATDQIMDDWREEGLGVRHYEIQNGTLFIDAGDPYLEHHGVLGMKWGKHLRAGKGPVDGQAGAGGGGGEDDEKLKEMAKKAGMTVAEYRNKFSRELGRMNADNKSLSEAKAAGTTDWATKAKHAIYGKTEDHAPMIENKYNRDKERKNLKKYAERQARLAESKYKAASAAYDYERKNTNSQKDFDKWAVARYQGDSNFHQYQDAKHQAEKASAMYKNSKRAKIDEAKRKARLTTDKLKTKASKVGEKISVKDKHLVINGSRSDNASSVSRLAKQYLPFDSQNSAPAHKEKDKRSFKQKAYDALGGKYKSQASEAHKDMVHYKNEADDLARRANTQSRVAKNAKKKGAVQDYIANKEGARELETEAKGNRLAQWDSARKANSAQWKYDHSIAGLYDKATGKYKKNHIRTAVPSYEKMAGYYYKEGSNNKLYNNGASKAKTAKDQAKAEVWKAADHVINSHDYYNQSYDPSVTAYGLDTAYRKEAVKYGRLAEGSYRRASALGKQASSESSTSSRPRARKKKHTSGGSGVSVRKPGRKPVSRTKRVTKSSTGVKRRGATGTGASVRRGAR